jgi:hypothetical protein
MSADIARSIDEPWRTRFARTVLPGVRPGLALLIALASLIEVARDPMIYHR